MDKRIVLHTADGLYEIQGLWKAADPLPAVITDAVYKNRVITAKLIRVEPKYALYREVTSGLGSETQSQGTP